MKRILIAAMLAAGCACVVADPPAPATSPEPSKVTIQVKGAKLADALKMLADQSHNALLSPPEKWVEKPVTVDAKDATFFEALDAICAAAGLRYDERGLTVAPALAQKDCGEYLGPAVVKAARLTKTRMIRDASYPQSSTLQVEIFFFWEQRLPVFCESCTITKVMDADGHQLQIHRRPQGRSFSTPAGPPFGPPAPEKPGLSGIRGFAMLDSVAAKLPATITIDGTAEISLGSGEKILTVSNVLKEGADLSAEEGNVSFTVKKVQRWDQQGGVRVFYGNIQKDAKNPISFIVELRSDGKDPLPLGGVGSPYGIFIVDPKGKRYPVSGTTGTETQKDDAWTATVFPAFDKPEGMDDAWSLVYVYPEKVATKEWPFTLKDVPLP